MQDNKQYEILRKMRTKTAFTFSLGKSFFFFFFSLLALTLTPHQINVKWILEETHIWKLKEGSKNMLMRYLNDTIFLRFYDRNHPLRLRRFRLNSKSSWSVHWLSEERILLGFESMVVSRKESRGFWRSQQSAWKLKWGSIILCPWLYLCQYKRWLIIYSE